MRRNAVRPDALSGAAEKLLVNEINDMIELAANATTDDADAAEYCDVALLLQSDLDGLTRYRHAFASRIGEIREARAVRRRAAYLAWRDRPNEGQSGGFFGR
jgi:hypothetical protein